MRQGAHTNLCPKSTSRTQVEKTDGIRPKTKPKPGGMKKIHAYRKDPLKGRPVKEERSRHSVLPATSSAIASTRWAGSILVKSWWGKGILRRQRVRKGLQQGWHLQGSCLSTSKRHPEASRSVRGTDHEAQVFFSNHPISKVTTRKKTTRSLYGYSGSTRRREHRRPPRRAK